MELRTIRVFLQVAKHLSFSKASEDLFLSQSSVSKYISSLEQELGHELFYRNAKNIMLTEFGREFMPYARTLVDDEDRTKCFMYGYNTRRVSNIFTLGMAASLSYAPADNFLSQLILSVEELKSICPQLVVRLKYIPDDELFPMLLSANLDMALFSACNSAVDLITPSGVTVKHLQNQDNYLLYPAEWGSFSTLEELAPKITCFSMAADPTPRTLTNMLRAELKSQADIYVCEHWSEMIISLTERRAVGLVPAHLLQLATKCRLNHLRLGDEYLSGLNLAWCRNSTLSNLPDIISVISRMLDDSTVCTAG